MNCPKCQKAVNSVNAKVLETRARNDGASIRRRRECSYCHKRFTTREYTVADLLHILNIAHAEVFSSTKINFALEDINTAQENLSSIQKELERLEKMHSKKKVKYLRLIPRSKDREESFSE